MELLQPWGLMALLGLPAIVALYFLRQRRPPRVVGSLILWQQARAQVFEGRPWERFRASWLLWLQLLVMGALALALARPACVSEGSDAGRLVLVLDASASMAATDVAPSRWSAAIDRARSAARAAPEGAEVAVLVAGRLTRVAEPFTRDRGKLEARLDGLARRPPDAVAANTTEAILLAMQLGGAEADREIVLISDGAFPADELPPIGQGRLTYVGVGASGDNLAITTFEVRRGASQRFGTTALCVVTNTGSAALSGHLQVRLVAGAALSAEVEGAAREGAGSLIEAQRVRLGPGEQHTLSVPLEADEGLVIARLSDIAGEGGARDHLGTDDAAFAVVAPERPVRVLLVGDGPLVERALRASARLEVEVMAPEDFTGQTDRDVMIFDGTFPATIPSGRFLALNLPAENPLVTFSGEPVANPTIASWDRGHPALLHLDLGAVRFGEIVKATGVGALVPLAEFRGEGGPAVLAGQTPSWRGLVLVPPLLRSDLPLRVAFPVFLYNALGWLSPGGEREAGHTVATGRPLAVPAGVGGRVEVVDPAGDRSAVTLSRGATDGVYLFGDTARAGFYAVEVSPPAASDPAKVGAGGQGAGGGDPAKVGAGGGDPAKGGAGGGGAGIGDGAGSAGGRRSMVFGVSLVDARESTIAPVARISAPRGAGIEAVSSVERVDEMTRAALLAALAIAMLEWALFLWRSRSRRPVGLRSSSSSSSSRGGLS